jgi:uncharacterized membrane protein
MDGPPPPRLYLDEVIAPARSLPKRGFAILMGVVIGLNAVVAALMLSLGAAPIPIFLCLDVLAVVVAFRVSYAQAAQRERVQVTADQVRVMRDTRAGPRAVWTSPTAFTRVDLDRSGRHGAEVMLRLSGRRMAIARALGPQERAALAEALDDAIRAAKAERHPT